MDMNTLCPKEQEGRTKNPMRQLSSVAVPWWNGLVSQPTCDESFHQLKSSYMEHPTNGNQLTTKQAECGTGKGLENGSTIQFTIFPGDCKSCTNEQKSPELQAAITMQSAPLEYRGCFELGFGQHMISAKYPFVNQGFGVFSTYGPRITGRILLPSNLTSDDRPIYVNAKQYNGIIRRRMSHAKAVVENKALRIRKPYLHLSRHLHALRRPRGCGGRFLKTKNLNGGKSGTDTKKKGDPQVSQNAGTLNTSAEEANSSRSNLSGSEVTSMYSRGNLDHFTINDLVPSVHPLSDMNTGHSLVMSSKWVAAANSCCNLSI